MRENRKSSMGKCTKCGTNFIGTPESPPADGLCHYCERDALKAENARLRKALEGIVQADTRDDLLRMALIIRKAPVCDMDKAVILNAIHALLACASGPTSATTGA